MIPGVDVPVADLREVSWLHRLDPIAKMIWVVAVIGLAFASSNPIPMVLIAIIAITVAVGVGIGRPLSRVLLVFAPVTASIIVIQTIAPATCASSCTVIARIGPLSLFEQGLSHGLVLVSRLLAVETVGLTVLMTTHPSDVFAALARVRVPYALNFMIATTLQLVPVLQREFAMVLAAQRSRAMRGRGFGAILPAFVPVFAAAFERVQQRSIGLESRGFGSSGPRTSYRRVRSRRVDAVIGLAGLAAGVGGVVLGLTAWSADRSPAIVLSPTLTVVIFLAAALMFVGVVVAGLRAIARS